MVNLGENFYPKLVSISGELGMKPEDLLVVMVSESDLDPAAHEQTYNGGGLIGFMPRTLRGLKFDGGPEDFRKLSGEQQLDWVKKFVAGLIQHNGGKPFTSAAQYYVANFVPAAMKLPGIISQDLSYAFLEENPETIVDPKTHQLLSKKYHEIGVELPAKLEREFYRANPGLHGSRRGAITYGDMVARVNKKKRSGLYQQTLASMKSSTGYQPKDLPGSETTDKPTSPFSDFITKLYNIINKFVTASPHNSILVSVGSSSDRCATVEYARVLGAAIDEYFGVRSAIYVDNSDVELSFQLPGDKVKICNAIKELSSAISHVFKDATQPIGPIETFALVMVDKKSDCDLLSPRLADLYCRQFKLKFARLR